MDMPVAGFCQVAEEFKHRGRLYRLVCIADDTQGRASVRTIQNLFVRRGAQARRGFICNRRFFGLPVESGFTGPGFNICAFGHALAQAMPWRLPDKCHFGEPVSADVDLVCHVQNSKECPKTSGAV